MSGSHQIVFFFLQAAATREVGKVLAKARSHAEAIRESADQFFFLNQELQASAVPSYDVHTAREVLETGTASHAASTHRSSQVLSKQTPERHQPLHLSSCLTHLSSVWPCSLTYCLTQVQTPSQELRVL